MDQKIAVGIEDFSALRMTGGYYVDKTKLLYELVESNHAVTLFTRPRRFGKTLTMSMMESFFSIFKKENGKVFDGLDIMAYPDFCTGYRNQYPTLFISFKDVEGLNFGSAFKKLQIVVSDLCKKYAFLEYEEKVLPSDAGLFHRLQFQEAGPEEVQNALKTIMRMMYAVYGKPVILLIDEYDVPLAKANSNGYYREILDVVRGIMSMSLKTNEYLKFAVVTGCLRIPKESIFTGVNNFASYSVINEDFSEYFGFTHSEINKLLAAFDLANHAETIKDWYDGYVFGCTEVYCPWDVVNYVSSLQRRRGAKPKSYWKNTSGNDAIQEFFNNKRIDASRKFEMLLNGGTISEMVTDELTYENAYESETNLWSILLMTGYVTLADPAEEPESGQEVKLRIPNRGIASLFQEAVADHFKKTVDERRLNELMDSLWNGNDEAASKIMSELLLRTISYMDYHEDYYHAFLAGLFRGRGFEVESNKERGLGRPDIQLIDHPNRRAVILEVKKSAKAEDMEADCRKGIDQIIAGQYTAGFDHFDRIVCYGVSFFRKSALVKKMCN